MGRTPRWILVGSVMLVLSCKDDERDELGGSGIAGWGESSSTGAAGTAGPALTGGGGGGGGGVTGEACVAEAMGGYHDCLAGGAGACEHPEARCLVNRFENPSWGVCLLPCQADCECWQDVGDGTAVPACIVALQDAETVCVLDCGDGRVCPTGMRCIGVSGVDRICVWDANQ